MKRKRIIIFTIISGIILWIYLQYGRDVKICSSNISSSDTGFSQHITVIANKLYMYDRDKFAREMVRRCIENSFHEIKFSHDTSEYPCELHISVYINQASWKLKRMTFQIDYEQSYGRGYKYNIRDNPEKFHLEIVRDGT